MACKYVLKNLSFSIYTVARATHQTLRIFESVTGHGFIYLSIYLVLSTYILSKMCNYLYYETTVYVTVRSQIIIEIWLFAQ